MLGLDTLFHKILFGIIATVANVVDVLIDFIRMILGLSPLEGSDSVVDLLESNLWTEYVLQALGIVMGIAASLIFIFALLRVVRAQLAEKDEGGHWKAVRGVLESIVLMFVIPIFAATVIFATSITAQAIDDATRDTLGTDVSYSTEVVFSTVDESILTGEGKKWFNGTMDGYQIFDGHGNQISRMTAVKLVYGGWTNGIKSEDKYYSDAACTVVLEPPLEGSDYTRLTLLVVEDSYFDTFVLPLLGGFVMLCALAMAAITITQRIFSVLFLFIIAPLPASFKPLDDGARYKKWTEIFLGKIFGGYGIVFALNVFFSLCPLIVSNVFFTGGFANGVARLIVYIAGIVFATGANVLIGQLIGADAGSAERDQASQNFRTTMSGAYWTGAAMRGARNIAGYPFGQRRKSTGKNPSPGGTADGAGALPSGGSNATAGATGAGTSAGATAGATGAKEPSGAAGGAGSDAAAPTVSKTIGGAMGSTGIALASGKPKEALTGAAKSAGRRIASTRLATAVAGGAMLIGGAVIGGTRALWGRTAGRNSYRSLSARAERARQEYERAKTIPQADKAWKKFQKLDGQATQAREKREQKQEKKLAKKAGKEGRELGRSDQGPASATDPRK